MPAEITELTFLEQLAERCKIPVPEHVSGDKPAKDLRAALERWGGRALVKPDVLAGSRGKSGAVVKVLDPVEAQKAFKKASGLELGGRLPRTAYAVQIIPAAAEAYTALTYDSRFLGPMLTVSMAGGVNIEAVPEKAKARLAVDVFKGLDAYQASTLLAKVGCPKNALSNFSRALVNVWDMFSSTGMRLCEINPWRITPDGRAVACDFKAVFDEANYKFQNLKLAFPEYPAATSRFEEEMAAWNAASHQGQAHVSELGGRPLDFPRGPERALRRCSGPRASPSTLPSPSTPLRAVSERRESNGAASEPFDVALRRAQGGEQGRTAQGRERAKRVVRRSESCGEASRAAKRVEGLILPVLFGGGASTIICETLEASGGAPIFLSDFGGNPPYERMRGTAEICFRHHLGKARLLLILGGKANNTLIDVTFQAIADALTAWAEEHGALAIPVVVGRGGPRLIKGLTALRNALEALELPYVIFGPDTPVTLVAEYAANLARAIVENGR